MWIWIPSEAPISSLKNDCFGWVVCWAALAFFGISWSNSYVHDIEQTYTWNMLISFRKPYTLQDKTTAHVNIGTTTGQLTHTRCCTHSFTRLMSTSDKEAILATWWNPLMYGNIYRYIHVHVYKTVAWLEHFIIYIQYDHAQFILAEWWGHSRWQCHLWSIWILGHDSRGQQGAVEVRESVWGRGSWYHLL